MRERISKIIRVYAIGVAAVVLLVCTSDFAQDKHSQQNLQSGIPYSISDIENINLTNGNLMFNLGFGAVKGRGTAMSGLSLKYNSKLYESHVMTTLDISGNNSPQKFLRADDESGWQYDASYELRVINRNDELDQPLQMSDSCGRPNYKAAYIWKLMMYFPDGSQHEFRPTGYSDTSQDTWFGQFQTGDGYFNVDTTGRITDLIWGVSVGDCPNYQTVLVNGQDPKSKMVYYSTDGTFIRLEIPNGQNVYPSKWTVYMPDGSRVANGELDAQSNPLPQRIYDKNGNFISGMVDELGRYISRVAVSSTEDHIIKLGVNAEPIIWKVKWKYITVIKKYTTSTATEGIGRCCYSQQVLVAEHKVVDEIELPSQLGGQKYIFGYNGHEGQVPWNQSIQNPNSSPGWGDLISVTLPSEAKAEYEFATTVPFVAFDVDDLLPLLGKVKEKRLIYDSVYDGSTQQITDTWAYNINQPLGTSMITGPDGGVTQQYFVRTDVDADLSGRVYKEVNPNGTIVERLWANNKVGGCPSYGCGSMRRLNTYVKTEFTTIPDGSGSPSLTAIKDLDYDKNGNVTKIKEYDWVSYGSIPRDQYGSPAIPSGVAPVRITENVYYNQTEDASNSTANNGNSYWNTTAPNVRVALSSTTVENGAGTPVSRSEFNYFDVNTTANLIETKTWDSTKGAITYPLSSANSVITTAQYDQYGNPILTTDANGNQTQITYGPVNGFIGLYPTKNVTAYQTPVARTSAAAYDFYTGLVTTATDVDNNVSVVTEYDALGRPTKVRSGVNPDSSALESWTRTEYNDVARRIIVRSDLEAIGDGKKVAIQHYDQLGRVRLSKTLEDAATQSATNETDGIKVQSRYLTSGTYTYQLTSNPYRANYSTNETADTMGWTRSLSVNTGRHAEKETFSGANLPAPWGTNTNSTGKVLTDIDANSTTSTDEAGKQRRTVEDALDRLIRVDEPDENGNLDSASSPTNYAYDTLGNLTQIIQGGQTRTFSYSSLSRLLSATNPESGTISYAYYSNGNLLTKTDARSISTTFTYDALNRATYRDYSDSTPDVIYTYDDSEVPFSKGKLTKVSSSVSESLITAYDAQERSTGSQQQTDGQTYSFGYTYNLDDDLLTQTYPSGKVVNFAYDSSGDLSRVGNATGFTYANSFGYAPHGQIEKMRYGNGRWESTQFNSRRQITQVGLGFSENNTGLWKTNYEYGDWQGSTLYTTKNNNSLASQTITVPTIGTATGFIAIQTYAYDSLDRIKSATETIGGSQAWKQTFLYDRLGNRNFDTTNTTILSNESNVGKIANPEILTSNNKLKEDQDNDGQPDYLYDPSGNLTKNAQGRGFTFNAENLQTTATGNGLSMAYSYDGNNKRIKSHNAVTGQTTLFVYDAEGDLAAEYTVNVPPPTTPTISYNTEDALGSVRVVTNAFGEIKSRRDFLPFGEELYAGLASRNANQKYSSNTDDTRKKFATYQRDLETGLDFAQSRYYSPMHGRFTSPDEFKGGPDELFDFEEDASSNPTIYADLTNPQSLNKYQYGYNNPYKYNDPTGHCPPCTVLPWNWVIPLVRPIAKVGTRVGDKVTDASTFGDPVTIVVIPKGGMELDDGSIVDSAGRIIRKSPYPVSRPMGKEAAGNAQAQARPRPNQMAGRRNAQKANQKRVDAAKEKIQALKEKLKAANQKPNKTPANKTKIDQIKNQIKNQQERLKESETHSRKGK